MPWSSIGDVPPQVRTHKGIPLSLAQANKWAQIYDSLKNNPKLQNPAAVAWTTWEKLYVIEDDKWIKRPEGKEEKATPIVQTLLDEHKPTDEDKVWAAFRKDIDKDGWYFSTIVLVDEPSMENITDYLWEGTYRLIGVSSDFGEVADSIRGFIDELPEGEYEFTIKLVPEVSQKGDACNDEEKTLAEGVTAVFCLKDGKSEVQSVVFQKDKFTRGEAEAWLKDNNFKYNTSRGTTNTWRFRQFSPDDCEGGYGQKFVRPKNYHSPNQFMESVVFISDPVLDVYPMTGCKSTIIHGVAVTTNVSNNHRFPEEVLARDIVTLIGQPLVEGHSMWPMDIEVKDIYGQVIDAWYNKDLKQAEFYAEVWDENYKIVLEKMPHRVKFSVGFEHDYDVEEESGVHVSKSAFFDHIGTTNRPADTDSVLLGIKENAEARGHKTKVVGERTIVVESITKKRSNGGNSMVDKEKEEKKIPEKKEEPEKEPAKEKPADESKSVKGTTPPAEPPAPKETEGEKVIVKRLEAAEKTLDEERTKRKELESKVLAFEQAEKKNKVEAYIDQLIESKVKLPSQKDDLTEQYLTFTPEQMKREIELNKVSTDLSTVFGESAQMKAEEEKKDEDKVPDRKTIT